MATVVRTTMVCDKDDCGAEAGHSHAFVLDGQSGMLDLCDKHQAEFETASRPWLECSYQMPRQRKGRSKARA